MVLSDHEDRQPLEGELFRLMVENVRDFAIFALDAEGMVSTWSPGAERCFGWSEAEILGREGAILFTPEDRAAGVPAQEMARARQEGRAEDERWHVRKDGYRFFASGVMTPIRDGTLRGYAKVARDITARKRAEQTARFLADAGAALAEVTDYEATLQRIASLAVPRFADWCTVDMVQADGPPRRLAVMHTDPEKVRLAHEVYRKYPPRPTDPRSVSLVLRTGEPDWATEIPDSVLEVSTHDPEHLRFMRELGLKSYICVPLRSRAGILGALTFVTAESGRTYDLSDVQAAQDLAGRAVIAIENATLLAALKEADRRKGEYLVVLAHELRNPLVPIRNALHILSMPGRDWSVVDRVRGTMERQMRHLGRLVDGLLDVSRIAQGKIQLHQERLDLGQLARQAVEDHGPAFAAQRVALRVEAPEIPVWVSGDGTRLAQILDNLLANALKFTGESGQAAVHVSAERDLGTAFLTVQDDGQGIGAEMLPRLFQPFSQADHTLDRSLGGLGLGLALVKALAELHGGKVRAESKGLGQGASFTVTLPLEPEPPALSGGPAPVSAVNPLRVLLVEDNHDAADTLALLLRMSGYEVTVANTGPDGVRAAQEQEPQVVICDIGLPEMDGYGVAAALRKHPATAAARLIALTGYGQEEDRRRAFEAGFDHHLTKPAEPSVLLRTLAGTATDGLL